MRRIWSLQFLFIFVSSDPEPREINWGAPQIEREHDPERYTTPLTPYLFGTHDTIPYYYETPDFRVEEPKYLAYTYNRYYIEQNRPFRLSPHYKAVVLRWRKGENMEYAGCYCTTVYKRLTPLAGCAVITTRHILTTASSTHLIMKGRYDYPHLENILGVWYDSNHNLFNSSFYLTPAQIFYHPWWHYPEDVNRSHPFSFTFDLAVWATTHNVYGWYFNSASTYLCLRATSHSREQGPPTPSGELFIIIGYQYMWAYNRKPMPWFKYGIRLGYNVNPCPKTEWGWFICPYADYLKYGIDNGALLHRTFQGWSWKYDGLVGLGAFSTNLRAINLVHYFTILDNHAVLDFLFDSYRKNKPPVFADKRFNHPAGQAPTPMSDYWIPQYYDIGHQHGMWPYVE